LANPPGAALQRVIFASIEAGEIVSDRQLTEQRRCVAGAIRSAR